MAPARRFLLLQGPVGPFFSALAAGLSQRGHVAICVRFNGGDRLYVRSRAGLDFTGAAADWPVFLDRCLAEYRITDLILYGDCRPLHRMAVEHVADRGLPVHVFEEGYLRPGRITLECGGVNGYSPLPRNASAYRDLAHRVSAADAAPAPQIPFARRAMEDVLHTVASVALKRRYPVHVPHKPWTALAEYRAGARRFFAKGQFRREAERAADLLLDSRRPFFLFPLQLDSDAQIRVHSPFGRMQPAIETVIRSFRTFAAADVRLVISEHPLDQGVVDLRPIVLDLIRAAGIGDRIVYLRGGTPPALLAASHGVVTINSTVGLAGLKAGRPVAVLGRAVYGIPGLVFERPLDAFWTAPTAPDAGLYADFERVLIARTQLAGGYYAPAARRIALDGALARLLGPATAGFPAAAVRTMSDPSSPPERRLPRAQAFR